jgi:hypothetical protein
MLLARCATSEAQGEGHHQAAAGDEAAADARPTLTLFDDFIDAQRLPVEASPGTEAAVIVPGLLQPFACRAIGHHLRQGVLAPQRLLLSRWMMPRLGQGSFTQWIPVRPT